MYQKEGTRGRSRCISEVGDVREEQVSHRRRGREGGAGVYQKEGREGRAGVREGGKRVIGNSL